ncbi:UDP-glucose/GDP-mannose dehydrogenase family protein [Patescibacteria group bacterium]|nr:UDP-glucose/GDP-mannose dehydrogenase family protein [Patescibacteria group bacterium]MBU4579394.1 UDP-glucose/GDP-mannose dehydrogenase family protein [Patescibacteria group bacterium]
MKIIIIGAGYVGLVQGVCLAELGNQVRCVDIDKEKIEKLKKGISPIYEPGIEELLKRNLKLGRIVFDTAIKSHMAGNEMIFIAVGTPPEEDGHADLKYVLAAAEEIGKNLSHYQIIANKSTVPIKTGQLVRETIAKFYKGDFDVVSNPEFLKEGSAVDDFMHPDRVVIGYAGNKEAAEKVAALYAVLGTPALITDLETAEMIKYASNSYLAAQISFINSLANICEKAGANIEDVARGMRMDERIGKKAFLGAGIGYGGSCFPKDVKSLIQIARDYKNDFKILEESEKVNKIQRLKFIERIKNKLGNLKGKKIAVWGLAFKPRTDDIRDAPSVTIVEGLLDLGAKIFAYDPVSENNFRKIAPDVNFCSSSLDACEEADALVIITEWSEFRQADLEKVREKMRNPIIFDGRNIYSLPRMKELGFKYISIGRPEV